MWRSGAGTPEEVTFPLFSMASNCAVFDVKRLAKFNGYENEAEHRLGPASLVVLTLVPMQLITFISIDFVTVSSLKICLSLFMYVSACVSSCSPHT